MLTAQYPVVTDPNTGNPTSTAYNYTYDTMGRPSAMNNTLNCQNCFIESNAQYNASDQMTGMSGSVNESRPVQLDEPAHLAGVVLVRQQQRELLGAVRVYGRAEQRADFVGGGRHGRDGHLPVRQVKAADRSEFHYRLDANLQLRRVRQHDVQERQFQHAGGPGDEPPYRVPVRRQWQHARRLEGGREGTYYQDASTGLNYADRRYYNATFGRFMSAASHRDRAAKNSPQSWNRYGYAANDPVNRNDPSGNDSCFIYAADNETCIGTADLPNVVLPATGSSLLSAAVRWGDVTAGNR